MSSDRWSMPSMNAVALLESTRSVGVYRHGLLDNGEARLSCVPVVFRDHDRDLAFPEQSLKCIDKLKAAYQLFVEKVHQRRLSSWTIGLCQQEAALTRGFSATGSR